MTNERVPSHGSLVRRVLWRTGGSALVLLFVVAVAYGVPLCPSAGFFGVPCPGCGLTRATLALLSGDVHGALALHPLVPLVAPALAALIGYAAYATLRGGPRRATSQRSVSLVTRAALVLCAMLIALWVARFAGYFGGPVPVTTYTDWTHSVVGGFEADPPPGK